jgi:TolB-like protein
MSQARKLTFGGCVLDRANAILTMDGRAVSLRPRLFELLCYLVSRAGQLVTKDQLLDAVWQHRHVSESVLKDHISDLRRALGDSAPAPRYIETVPRRGYRFVAKVEELAEAEATAGSPLTLPDKPSIAVMPFTNMSGDPEQEYFADGMVDEITTALSRLRWLFVIARNSSFTYKGRAVNVQQVGRDLGVRYVLEGGVRKAANRLRITAQLIDALTGSHLWADRFEGVLDDIFRLQDQVTASVVGAIAPRLEQAEIERSRHKPTESLGAYDHYLRGMASLYQETRETNAEALRHFAKAIELDRDFSSAYGMAALCHIRRKGNRWTADPANEASEGIALARRAVELGREDAVALATGGYAFAYFAGDFDAGVAFIDRALALNPNLASAWSFSGRVRTARGETDLAIEHLGHSMRLSPLDPFMFVALQGIALAHFCAGRDDEASSWAQNALRENPNYHSALRVFVASNALAGRMEAAQKAMAHLRRIDPALRIADLEDLMPPRRPNDVARFAEGLRKAGLPE